jgi:hypothetical protein
MRRRVKYYRTVFRRARGDWEVGEAWREKMTKNHLSEKPVFHERRKIVL